MPTVSFQMQDKNGNNIELFDILALECSHKAAIIYFLCVWDKLLFRITFMEYNYEIHDFCFSDEIYAHQLIKICNAADFDKQSTNNAISTDIMCAALDIIHNDNNYSLAI